MSGPPESFASLLRARRGYLATSTSAGEPHLVPVCFTWAGDAIYTAVDAKPKSTQELQRVKDLAANSNVAFIVDRWDEDWSRLSWLQARGKAFVLSSGAEVARAKEALASKYSQYQDMPLDGAVIKVEVERWLGWEPSSGSL